MLVLAPAWWIPQLNASRTMSAPFPALSEFEAHFDDGSTGTFKTFQAPFFLVRPLQSSAITLLSCG